MKHLLSVLAAALFALFSPVACNGADPPDTSNVASYEEACQLGGVDWELTDYQTVVTFDPRLETPDPFDGEHPEGLAFDPWSNTLFVSLALTGEVARVDMNTGEVVKKISIPFFVPGMCPGAPWPAIMGPPAVDMWGNVYVGVGSCEDKAIIKIDRHDDVQVIATLPPYAAPNGSSVRSGRVYVVDSVSPVVWMANTNGDGGPAGILTTDPLLEYVPNPVAPGTNGNIYDLYEDRLIFSNPSAGIIGAIDFDDRWNPDSAVGAAYVLHNTPVGPDDGALLPDGTLIWGTDPFNTAESYSQDGTNKIVLDVSDGLDGPTDIATRWQLRDGELGLQGCVSNGQFPFFPSTGYGPSIQCGWLAPSFSY